MLVSGRVAANVGILSKKNTHEETPPRLVTAVCSGGLKILRQNSLMDKENMFNTHLGMGCSQASDCSSQILVLSLCVTMKCYGISKVPHIHIYQLHEIFHQHKIKSTGKLTKQQKTHQNNVWILKIKSNKNMPYR